MISTMFIARLLTLGVFASGSIGLALTIPSTPSVNEQFASEPQSFIVKLKPGHSSRSHFSTISKGRHSLKLKSSRTTYFESNIFNGYATQLADQAAVEALSQMDSVEYVEPDVVFSVASLVRQTNTPWGLQAITRSIPFPAQHGVSEALNYTYEFDSTAGQGVDIYILDSGVYANHSEFGNRVQHAPVFARYTTTGDVFGHGTHVAGIAAGAQFGVAKQAQIIDVKVITDTGRGFASDIISGLSWAVAHANSTGRPCVFNFSLGGGTSTALDDAMAAAVNAGFPTVVAAGNANVDIVAANWSPARVPGVIAVGNVDINGVRSESSNYGSPVAVFAPGVNITSAGIASPNSTRVDSGTSMAAPHVAGLAAYLIGLEGPRSPSEMKARLQALARVDILSGIPNGTVNLMAQNIFLTDGTA